MPAPRCISAAALAASVALASACGGGSSSKQGARQLVSIAVTPPAPSLAKGTTLQLAATGTYSDGSTGDVTAEATWTSSDAAVSVLDQAGQKGLLRGMLAGGATVRAAVGAVSGGVSVTVTPATLVSLGVTPAAPTVPRGLVRQFAATGVFTDDTTQDLTADVAWESTDPSKATISNAAGSKGLAQTVAAGATMIRATHAATGRTGSVALTVTPAALAAVAVTAASPSVPAGLGTAFTALGTFTDGSTRDVTASLAWTSSDAAKATVSDAAGTKGRATSHAAGSVTITASEAATSVSGSAALTVTAAELVSLAVSPAAGAKPKGLPAQFAAIGTFTDGSTQDLTAQATWTSSDAANAPISNAAGTKGRVATLGLVPAPGATIGAATGGFSASARLEITSAALVSIAIAPASPTVVASKGVQLGAIGTYTDGTTQDLTAAVTWSSSAASAVVSNAAGSAGAPGSQGLATAISPGAVTITATMPGTGVAGSTPLTVSAPALTSLVVLGPGAGVLPVGFAAAFEAFGTYEDGLVRDVTSRATWSATGSGSVSLSAQGVATGVASGAVTVTGSLDGSSATADVAVTPDALTQVNIFPALGAPELPVGAAVAFMAVGTFAGDPTKTLDLTPFVTFTSREPEIAFAGNVATASAVPAAGTMSARVQGAGIPPGVAQFQGFLDVPLPVVRAALTSIAISPAVRTLLPGATDLFVAEGDFSDFVTLTVQASWSTSDAAIATVDAAGNVTAVAPGSAIITASAEGLSGTSAVTVAQPAQLRGFSVVAPSLVGGNPVTLQLWLDLPLSGADPTEVSFSSSDPAIAAGSCPLVPGLDAALCSVSTSGVAAPITVTLTATYRGVSRSATVSLAPASAVAFIAVEPILNGATTQILRVVLDGAAGADYVVALASSNVVAAPVPATLVVPAGERLGTAIFTTGTFTGSAVDVTVTATFPGGATRSDTFRVNATAPGTVTSIVVPPSVAVGATDLSSTVSIFPNAAAATVVTLQTVDPFTGFASTDLSVPPSVTIPAGLGSVTFPLTGVAPAFVRVTASAGGASVSGEVLVQ